MAMKWVSVMTTGIVVVLSLSFPYSGAMGADYPRKPVKIVVSVDVGGGEDIEARALAPAIQKHLGVNVTVEPQPGAGGKICFEKFMKTEPDGYTVLYNTFPKSVILEVAGKVNFRTREYVPVFGFSRPYNGLSVNVETWKTFDEFLKAAKAKPLAGGLPGRLTIAHLAGLLAADELGIKVNWVPYEGSAGSLAAVAGKHIDFTIGMIPTTTPLVQAGKIRNIAIFADKRDPFFPDVPTPKEMGYTMPAIPGIRGMFVPPKTPPAIVKALEEACSKAIKDPTLIEWAKKRSVTLQPVSSQEFGKEVAEAYTEVERFQAVLKESGL